MFGEDPRYRRLMDYATRILARRSYTAQEMRDKLRKREQHSPELEEQVLKRLKEINLVNDESYVRNYLELNYLHKHQGFFKVAQKLKQKGIDPKETEELWNKLEVSEYHMAREALRKALKRINKYPPEKRAAKIVSFLASRGFKPRVIYKLSKFAISDEALQMDELDI